MYQWTRADTVLENSLRIYRRKRGTSGLCFHSLGVPLRHKDSILIPSLVLQVGGTQKKCHWGPEFCLWAADSTFALRIVSLALAARHVCSSPGVSATQLRQQLTCTDWTVFVPNNTPGAAVPSGCWHGHLPHGGHEPWAGVGLMRSTQLTPQGHAVGVSQEWTVCPESSPGGVFSSEGRDILPKLSACCEAGFSETI